MKVIMNQGYTLYIVDDDPLILQSLQTLFSLAGFSVRVFNDANAFLQTTLVASHRCLILDLQMPQLSGLEVQQQLLARGWDIPIVIYTGSADVTSAVKVMFDGAYTLVQKPAPNDVLIKTVTAAITKHHEKRSAEQLCKNAQAKLALLTERERNIALHVANGLSAPAIAKHLFISARTVEAHKASIFNKLDIKSVTMLTQLVTLARLDPQFHF